VKRPVHFRRDIAFPYVIINTVFFAVLLGIMIYSAVFSVKDNHYPIPSSLEIIRHGKDISSGLSHGFSELIRGRVQSARAFNEHGPRIFCFFLFQMLMRVIFSLLYLRYNRSVTFICIDVGVSIALFIFAFLPFIERLAVTIIYQLRL